MNRRDILYNVLFLINIVKMRSINNKQFRDQMRAHYNHVSKCDDHHTQPKNTGQSEPDNCSCPDYSEQMNRIEVNITEINNRLTIIENILNNLTTQGINTEETVTLSTFTPTAGTVRSIDSPNTVAFDSLLAEVEEWDSSDMENFYSNYISPVIARNDYNLLAPIPVSALCSCTRVPEVNNNALWENLEDENKRAYIMQFILANRSNSTRAMYLTNQLIGAFALPL